MHLGSAVGVRVSHRLHRLGRSGHLKRYQDRHPLPIHIAQLHLPVIGHVDEPMQNISGSVLEHAEHPFQGDRTVRFPVGL